MQPWQFTCFHKHYFHKRLAWRRQGLVDCSYFYFWKLFSSSPDVWHPWMLIYMSFQSPGPRFNMQIPSWKSHCGDKTVVRSSYLHNGISYTGKMASLYCILNHGPDCCKWNSTQLCSHKPGGVAGQRWAFFHIPAPLLRVCSHIRCRLAEGLERNCHVCAGNGEARFWSRCGKLGVGPISCRADLVLHLRSVTMHVCDCI